MKSIIVSACLMGENCKYNGGNNLKSELVAALKDYNVILICPEVDGGLSIPRVPAEIIGEQVINQVGIDVTSNYLLGANLALKKALENDVKIAILKAKSPSCGSNQIYDGTFSHTLTTGDGVTSKLFKANGIKVYTENNYQEIFQQNRLF